MVLVEKRLVEVEPGIRLAVNVSGSQDKPTIVFSNSLAASMGMWDEVAEYLAPHARLVRYDTRGHGGSSAPEDGYSLERISLDLIAILDDLSIQRAVICGVSLGGLIAMWLGIHAPNRVDGLVLANTAASFPPASMWRERAAMARQSGVTSFVEPSLDRWVTADYRQSHGPRVEELAAMILQTSPSGYAGCCEVLAASSLLPELPRISCPVRVIAGRYDPSTPPDRASEIAMAIPQSNLVTLNAAHISCVEAPSAFGEEVRQFIAGK